MVGEPRARVGDEAEALSLRWANLVLVAGAVGAYMLQKHIRALSDFDFFVHAT